MGVFDYITSKYPLPAEGANAETYQTKSLDRDMGMYEIREDGTLWRRTFLSEDERFFLSGSPRWVQAVDFTGEVVFRGGKISDPLDWSAYFVDGKLVQIHRINKPES